MKKTVKKVLAVSLCIAMLAGCSNSGTTQPGIKDTPAAEPPKAEEPAKAADPAKAAEAEKAVDLTGSSVVVYNSSKEEEMVIHLENFEKEAGAHGETVRLSAGEALGRITVEKENPKADVWYSGGIDAYIQAKEQGLLEPYISPAAESIPGIYKDPDGYFTGVALTYLVIGYNKALLDEKGVSVPKSWQDLLKPEYKGQITMANPGSSGTAYTFLSTICQLYGEEKGMEYMKALNENIKSYEKSGSAPSRLVAQGEAMIGITYFHDIVSYQEQGFKDFFSVVPEEGTGYEVSCTALIKNAANPEAAKRFIDFVLRPENQVVTDQVGYYVGHTQPDAKVSEPIANLGDIPLIDYDFQWSGSNRNRLVEEWSTLIGE